MTSVVYVVGRYAETHILRIVRGDPKQRVKGKESGCEPVRHTSKAVQSSPMIRRPSIPSWQSIEWTIEQIRRVPIVSRSMPLHHIPSQLASSTAQANEPSKRRGPVMVMVVVRGVRQSDTGSDSKSGAIHDGSRDGRRRRLRWGLADDGFQVLM